MLNFTKVLSSNVDKLKRRVIKVLRLGKQDVQTNLQTLPFGIDSVPIKDLVALYAPTNEKGKSVIIGYLNKNSIAGVGETRFYSTNEQGVEQNSIHLKNNGDIEVGGNSDFMVKFNALQNSLNNYNTLINAELVKIGTATSGLYVPLPPIMDVSTAKTLKIKTS